MLTKQFDKYVAAYDLNNSDIKLKYNHSYRVMNLMEKYAKQMKYSKEDIRLAKIIGLLHDFGRFEQLRVYNSYDDSKTIDHANYSVDILFKGNKIELFTKKKDWYPIIEFAIKNHNKYQIDETTDKKKIKFAKLIRDIDKLDIIYLLGYLREIDIRYNDDSISEEILKDIFAHTTSKKTNMKTNMDHVANRFAFAFEIENDCILKELKQNLTYYYKLLDEKKFKEIYEETMKYIDERIENYERNSN